MRFFSLRSSKSSPFRKVMSTESFRKAYSSWVTSNSWKWEIQKFLDPFQETLATSQNFVSSSVFFFQ